MHALELLQLRARVSTNEACCGTIISGNSALELCVHHVIAMYICTVKLNVLGSSETFAVSALSVQAIPGRVLDVHDVPEEAWPPNDFGALLPTPDSESCICCSHVFAVWDVQPYP